jgi:hypothetical protein
MRRFVITLICAAWLAAASSAQASMFGVTPHLPDMTAAQVQQLANGGGSAVRVNVNIDNVEQSGWGLTDGRIAKIAAARLGPIVVLSGLPDFTAASADRWKPFVRAAVHRYKPAGTFWAQHPDLPIVPVTWVAGNEPNISWSWSGTLAQWAQLVQTTANIAHSEQSSARVFVGAMSPNGSGISYLSDVLGRINTSSFAGVGAHPFAVTPDDAVDYVRWVRGVLVAHGMGTRSILVDEIGWRSDDIGEAEQADRMRRFFAAMRYARDAWHIYRVLWYGWRDNPNGRVPLDRFGGMFRSDGTAKPSWGVFRKACAW